MASSEEANTNMLPVVDDYDDCFDFSFLFQDDDQSLPENNTTMMMTSAEPILDTNMPCMDVIPAAFHQDTVGSNNKRTRVDVEEAISTLKRFKPMETLENPDYLIHQETLQNPNHLLRQQTLQNPMPSQPYIVNNITGGIPSGYTVGGFGPTNMAIFGGSRRKTPSPWTIEEHVRFLVGIAQGFKGDWKTISRVYVRTRTAAQVTSHAQKHFLHQEKRNNYSNGNGSANPSMVRRRRSIYDIANLADVEISKYAEALRYVRSPINN